MEDQFILCLGVHYIKQILFDFHFKIWFGDCLTGLTRGGPVPSNQLLNGYTLLISRVILTRFNIIYKKENKLKNKCTCTTNMINQLP